MRSTQAGPRRAAGGHATCVCDGVEKQLSKRNDEFGACPITGVAGPEAANYLACGGGSHRRRTESVIWKGQHDRRRFLGDVLGVLGMPEHP
jgi:hypothetical protein